MRSASGPRLHQPPGLGLLRIAEFLYTRKTFEDVFLPTVTDLQDEYMEALAQGRTHKARWVRIRGYWSFFAAMGLQSGVGALKRAVQLWRLVT